MFTGILVGIGISQLICFLVFVLTHEDEMKAMLAGGGIFLLPVKWLFMLMRAIWKAYVNHTYTVYKVCGVNENFWNQYVRLKKKWFDNYYHEGENDYYIEEYLEPKNKPHNYDPLRKLPGNGWWNQEWVNKNLLKES